MKRCVIHIGVPRTGSTSIQWVLWRNRGRLREKGFHVPSSVGGREKRRLALFADTQVHLARRQLAYGVRSLKELSAERSRFASELSQELAQLPKAVHTVILSQERLSLCHVEQIESLKELLAPFCDSFSIVAFLRRQDLQRVSGQKNQTKNLGRSVDPFDRPILDYSELLDRWAAVFGKASVQPHVFPDSARVKTDLIDTFLAAIDLDDSEDIERPSSARNPGWDARAVELMALVNEYLPVQYGEQGVAARYALEQILKKGFTDSYIPYRPARAAAIRYYSLHAEPNEQLRRDWFPGLPTVFHEDFSMYPEAVSQELAAADCAFVIAALARKIARRRLSGQYS